MPTIRDTYDESRRLQEQAWAILKDAEKQERGLTTEEEERFAKLTNKAELLTNQIQHTKRLKEIEDKQAEVEEAKRDEEARTRRAIQEPEERKALENRVFEKYLRVGMNGLNHEERSIMQPASGEMRAQAVGTGGAGGYLVPEDFSNQLEQNMLAFGGVRQVARVIQTATGADLPWPTVDDTGNSGTLLAENTAATETAVSYNSITFGAYKWTSDLVLVSRELTQDSAFQMGPHLAALLGERIARAQNTYFTTGTGTGQPNGCLTAATDSTIDFDLGEEPDFNDMLDVYHALDPSHRANASWMMSDATLLTIKKIHYMESVATAIAAPNFVWQQGLAPGAPNTILGKPYVVNQDMPAPTGTNKCLLFGDFSKYVIRDVLGTVLLRLEERYAEYFQIGFVAFARADGDLLDAGTAPLVYLECEA